eukprot:g58885.t1
MACEVIPYFSIGYQDTIQLCVWAVVRSVICRAPSCLFVALHLLLRNTEPFHLKLTNTKDELRVDVAYLAGVAEVTIGASSLLWCCGAGRNMMEVLGANLHKHAEHGFQPYLCMVFLSFLFHYGVFKATKTDHHKPDEYRSRVASNAHCYVILLCVLAFVLNRGGIDVWDGSLMLLGHGLSPKELLFMRLVVSFSIGFFCSDIFVMATYPEAYTADAMLHHIIIMPFFGVGIWMNVCTPYHFLYLLEEISTPVGNWRWMLLPPKGQQLAPKEADRLRRVGYLFAASFLLARGLAGQAFWFTYFPNHWHVSAKPSHHEGGWVDNTQEMVSYIQFSVCTCTRVLNYYWIYLIYKAATRTHKSLCLSFQSADS